MTNSLALSVIQSLNKQRYDGLVSYDKWLVSAKSQLKWNDNAIRLFWDLLHMCAWYMKNSDVQVGEGREEEEVNGTSKQIASMNVSNNDSHDQLGPQGDVEFEYFVIFLILHTTDSQAK